MLLSAVSVLVVARSSSEIPEGLMNNPVHSILICDCDVLSLFPLQCNMFQYMLFCSLDHSLHYEKEQLHVNASYQNVHLSLNMFMKLYFSFGN